MNKEWFVFKGTQHIGPFSVEEIANLYQSKEISEQTLIWKEGSDGWKPLSKTETFSFLSKVEVPKVEPKKEPAKPREIELPKLPAKKPAKEVPPPLPHIPTLPKAAPQEVLKEEVHGVEEEELPPPIPLDALINLKEAPKTKLKSKDWAERGREKKSKFSKLFLFVGLVAFSIVIAWYAITEKNAEIQLRIKGLMPVYLEKLEMTATKNTPNFEVAIALSLDSHSLWASTNKSGEINTVIKLTSVSKRVLGTENVALTVKGEFKNHVGKFERMILTQGSRFLPGEYNFHVEGRQTHFINQHFKSLSGIAFFKSLNKSFSYDGSTLIYPGTPREFEKKITDLQVTIASEMLRPYQEKLEHIQTFESVLNATSQNYLMTLEKIKTGREISVFESKFVKEISPLLQSLVVKANDLSQNPKFNEEGKTNAIAPYREQVLLGKQIGEMASDMITKTQKFKKLKDADKSALRLEFDKRARAIKLQIDLNLKKLEQEIAKISK